MIVVDTNVVSELARPRPCPEVVSWFERQRLDGLYLSVVTGAEMLAGLLAMPEGHRRDRVEDCVIDILEHQFDGRVLAFDAHAAIEYATVLARRRAAGRPIATADAMIAAHALVGGAALATRNTRDFEGLGLELVDPWAR